MEKTDEFRRWIKLSNSGLFRDEQKHKKEVLGTGLPLLKAAVTGSLESRQRHQNDSPRCNYHVKLSGLNKL